jgi:hypothetical protein
MKKKFYCKELVANKIMKEFFSFLLFLFVLNTQAQKITPILERKISVTVDNEKTINVLNLIAQEGRFSFSYNASIIQGEQQTTIKASNKAVREVLNEIFKGTINYKEKNDHLILTKAPVKQTTVSNTVVVISGYVEDAETKEKVAEASVYDKESVTAVVTDEYGYFKIKLDKKNQEASIAVSKKDYRDTLVTISAPSNQYLNISITPIQKDSLLVKAETITMDTVIEKKAEELIFPYEDEPNIKNISDTLYRDIQVSFLPFLGTNGRLSGNIINDYSINFLGGYSLGTRQIELGFFFNLDRGNVKWLQIAGFGNLVGGDVFGIQAAGFFNVNGGSTVAAQAAGFTNINFKDMNGVQAAGFANINLQSVSGASIAGFANITNGASKGFQVAGFGNVQNGDYQGSQIAGATNIASGHLDGSQISTLFNYGKKIRGSQIGLINYADSLGGVPIGLFSVVKHGYHKMELSGDEVFYSNLAFRSGVNQFYNIIFTGMQPQVPTDNKVVWTFGYGVGTAPKLTRWLDLNIDLTSQQVNKGGFTAELSMLNKLYLGFDFHIAKKFSIATGVTLNGYLTKTSYSDYPTLFTDFNPSVIYEDTYNNSTNLKLWLGAKVGIRFF